MTAGSAPGLGRRLISNTLHAASGRVAGVVVWIVFAPLILSSLGESRFGLWALFFALTGQFAALDFGLVQSTLRHIADAREAEDHSSAAAFAVLGIIGFAILAALWFALTFLLHPFVLDWMRIPSDHLELARWALFAAPVVFMLAGVANITIAVAQGYGRFDLGNRVVLVLAAQQALGIPIVLHFGWGLMGLIGNVGLGWAFGAALGAVLVGRAVPEFHWTNGRRLRRHVRATVSFGIPLQLTYALAVVNLHVDKLLLARTVSLATVTSYEFGSRVAGTAIMLPQLLLLAILPAVAALNARGDRERIRTLYNSAGRYVLTATAMVVASLCASADRLYSVWLGTDMGDAALVLRGWTISFGLAMTGGMASTVARGIGRPGIETWFHVVALTIHVVASVLLLPTVGVAGAMAGLVAGHLAGAILQLALLKRALSWTWTDTLIRPNGVPLIGTLLGVAVGTALERVLPGAGRGALAWMSLAAIAGAAAGTTLATASLLRFVSWREFQETIRGSREAAHLDSGAPARPSGRDRDG